MKYGFLPDVTLDDGQTYKGFKVVIPNPPKVAVVRIPTSQEIADVTTKEDKLKKGDNDGFEQLHLGFFNKIRVDNGEPFDQYEAHAVIMRLLQCTTLKCEKVESEYHVTLHTPFGDVTHQLRFPSYKQIAELRNASYNNKAHLVLYEKLYVSSDGYDESVDVPGIHKIKAAGEVVLDHLSIDPVAIDPNS
jgi:hypothetical protein